MTGVAVWIERRLWLTPAGQAVTGASLIVYLLGRIVESRPVVLLALAGLAVVGMAYLSGRRRIDVVASRGDIPTRVREGQAVDGEVVLTARRRTTTIVAEEELNGLASPVRVPVALLPAGQEVRQRYRFVAGRRGVYRVGPLVAEWSDPFGLTRRRRPLAPAVELLVHPHVEAANDRVQSRQWEDPPVRPPLSKPWPTGFEFYGLRDYASGDDPRRIVWRATARTMLPDDPGRSRYLVREAEQGITDEIRLLLDTDADGHSMGGPADTFELAVRTVASLGVRHLRDGFSVTVDASRAALTGPLRGGRSRITLLDSLARVAPERTPLEAALDRWLMLRGGRAHHVVVTPSLSAPAASRLRILLDRGASVLIALVLSDATDPGALHRAAALGANVVEVAAGAPLERQLSRVVAGR